MRQVNLQTGGARPVKNNPGNFSNSSADDSVTSGHSSNLQDGGIIMTLRCPHEVLSSAKDRLKAELKKSISNPSFDNFLKE